MCFNLTPKGIIMTEQQQLDILHLIDEQLSKKRKELSRKLIELEIQNQQRIMYNRIIDDKELYENINSHEIQSILKYKKQEDYHSINNLREIFKKELEEIYIKLKETSKLRNSVVESYKILKDLENDEQTEDNSIKD
jgi:hypothetical protein